MSILFICGQVAFGADGERTKNAEPDPSDIGVPGPPDTSRLLGPLLARSFPDPILEAGRCALPEHVDRTTGGSGTFGQRDRGEKTESGDTRNVWAVFNGVFICLTGGATPTLAPNHQCATFFQSRL